MKPIRLGLCLCALVSLAAAGFAQHPPDPKIEIYIPTGMPIRIEVTRDENEQAITKYNIKRIVGPEVDKVMFTVLNLGPDNELRYDPTSINSSIAKNEARVTTNKDWPLASKAWVSSADVRRFIIIVERVETDSGAWVFESENQRADLRAIVERSADALPRAKFIKKE